MAVNIVDLTQSPTIPVAPRAETPDSVAIEFAVANDSKETLRRIVKASSRIQPLAVKFLENELLASMTSVKNGDSISTNEETEDDEDDEEEQGTDEDSEDNNEDKEVKAHTAVPRAYEQPLAQVAGQKPKGHPFGSNDTYFKENWNQIAPASYLDTVDAYATYPDQEALKK